MWTSFLSSWDINFLLVSLFIVASELCEKNVPLSFLCLRVLYFCASDESIMRSLSETNSEYPSVPFLSDVLLLALMIRPAVWVLAGQVMSGVVPALYLIQLLRRAWYVQNVSILSNTFAIVLHLICMIWMELTRTNTIFSRIALLSYFCGESQLSGKSPKLWQTSYFFQKTHGARRRVGGGAPGHHATPRNGGGGTTPSSGVVASVAHRRCSFNYLSLWPKNVGEFVILHRNTPERCRLLETQFGYHKFLFLHPKGMGRRRSSPSSSPPPLHQPSMIPQSMCE